MTTSLNRDQETNFMQLNVKLAELPTRESWTHARATRLCVACDAGSPASIIAII